MNISSWIHDYTKPLMHYACIGALLVLVYFLGAGILDRMHPDVLHGPQVTITAPTPNPVGKVVQTAATVVSSGVLNAAIHGAAPQLSMAQQTIANTAQSLTGATAQMSGALAYGLTQGPPKAQVIAVQTKAAPTASFTPPSPSPNDDAIKADMKAVLAETTVNAKVDTNVNVSWEDRPFTPFSAVYTSNGASGAALEVAHTPALEANIDALIHEGKPEVGLDLEHILKGTSAGVGVGATYNISTHNASPEVTVHVHM